ncbi:MAG: DNA-binding protein [Thermoplasmata archaeon]|nr:DNA-binding protein [Thermoplasmata archaeon]MVT12890.1 DNA-binding protein [Euryarchaeota archaeon]MVT15161.1 DNA-binding protein [Euryarchaeota archaeon]MVT36450.1 DNA-binding protein [Euryarchaeota archaeon]
MAEEDRELEEIRRRKLAQLLAQQSVEEQEIEKEKEVQEERLKILRKYLSSEARERLNRVKLVKPELAEAVENQIIYLAQTGRLNRVISDEEIKTLLARLSEGQRDIKIERR